MSRTLSTKSQGEVPKQVTRPAWFVALGLTTPLNLSSRETQTISGTTYTSAGIKVDLGARAVELFNEAFQFSANFLAGAAGRTCKIYVGYGAGPFVSSDLEFMFDGMIGKVDRIAERIRFNLRDAEPLYTPRIVVGPPTFNSVPPGSAITIGVTGTQPLK